MLQQCDVAFFASSAAICSALLRAEAESFILSHLHESSYMLLCCFLYGLHVCKVQGENKNGSVKPKQTCANHMQTESSLEDFTSIKIIK